MAPDETVPLITARCARCGRIAAKYWERGPAGRWITADPLPVGPPGAHLGHMVAAVPCRCEPAPVLPEGELLAALIERAHAKSPERRGGRGVLTIRV